MFVRPKKGKSVSKVFVDPIDPKFLILLFWIKGQKVPFAHYLKPMSSDPLTQEDVDSPEFQKLLKEAVGWCRESNLKYPGIDTFDNDRK